MEIISSIVLFLMFFGGYYFFGFHLTEKQRDNLARNLHPDYDSGGGTPVDENDIPIKENDNPEERKKILNDIILLLKKSPNNKITFDIDGDIYLYTMKIDKDKNAPYVIYQKGNKIRELDDFSNSNLSYMLSKMKKWLEVEQEYKLIN